MTPHQQAFVHKFYSVLTGESLCARVGGTQQVFDFGRTRDRTLSFTGPSRGASAHIAKHEFSLISPQ